MCINQRDDISHVKKKSAVSIQSADSLSPQSSTNIYYIQYIMYIWWFFIHIILYISMNIHIHWVYVMWILHHSQIIFLTRYLGTKTLFIGSFIICICIFKWFSLLVYYDLLFFSEIEFESIASIVCKKKMAAVLLREFYFHLFSTIKIIWTIQFLWLTMCGEPYLLYYTP